MSYSRRTLYVNPTPTPICDRLAAITQGNPLATYHGQEGGEWDTLARVPLRTRQRLTSAGFLARDGEAPDVFADLIVRYGGTEVESFDQGDPIGWFVREALRALAERKAATALDRKRRLAKSNGYGTYYAYRVAWCRERGYRSLWAYRQAQRWTRPESTGIVTV